MKRIAEQVAGWKVATGAFIFSLICWLAFVLPDHPGNLTPAAFAHLPVEWPLLGIFLLLLRGRALRTLLFIAGLIVFLVMLLKLADIGVQTAFQRPFNPYLDAKMLRDGWNLISGTIGNFAAISAILGAVAFILVAIALFLKAGKWMARATGWQKGTLICGFSVILLAGVVLRVKDNVADFGVVTFLNDRLSLITRSVSDMKSFERQLTAEEGQTAPGPLFQGISGKDVVLVFIESYGRSALEDPRYSGVTLPRLGQIEAETSAAGLKSVSGWLTSPTVGGLSWLAHGTLLSGLWVDSQARYDRLMVSQQSTLNRLFSGAGWKSVAVMPAITMEWPEAGYFGYDQVLAAKDLQYRGKPFNWVTMPDQYTLSAFETLALEPAHAKGRNVMAEIALISSHAPWTPVPQMIDWSAIGDGSIFDAQAMSGMSPTQVWADPEKVRDHYIGTIDYSLEVLGSFMQRHARNTIFVLVGDHQPASIITGDDASRAVPVHILTDDETILSGLEAAGFVRGMRPATEMRERRMSDMRQIMLDVFSAR